MQFTADRDALTDELVLASAIVDRKITIPILANVLLRVQGAVLEIVSTNLELGVCLKSVVIGDAKDGAVTLPAKRLLDIVKSLPEGNLSVSASEKNWCVVTSGTFKFKLAGLPAEDFPSSPSLKTAPVSIPASALASAAQRILPALPVEKKPYGTNGTLLLVRGGKFTCVGTDTHRLAVLTRDEISGELNALVPGEALDAARRIFDAGDVEVIANDNHCLFRSGDRELWTRLLTERFPAWEPIVPKSFNAVIEIDREEFLSAVRRIANTSDGVTRIVRLEYEDSVLRLSSQDKDAGSSEGSIAATSNSETLHRISFNWKFIADFLAAAASKTMKLSLVSHDRAAQLSEGDGVDYKYVVMPVSL